ncbi:unnamed protein product [Amoebophrya sp. A120]|nr:unnamed protein product [Amoebophrya sp. A120]|eukprot:GSA120T00004491001.1
MKQVLDLFTIVMLMILELQFIKLNSYLHFLALRIEKEILSSTSQEQPMRNKFALRQKATAHDTVPMLCFEDISSDMKATLLPVDLDHHGSSLWPQERSLIPYPF